MSYCPKCGKEVSEESSFCQQCGRNLSIAPANMQTSNLSPGLTKEDYKVFVGKNCEKYLTKFAKFNMGGIDSFKATWHWPAFFVPFWWLLYRKMYGWAILAFFTSWIPYIGWFLAPIIWAITANYIYYRHAKKKLLEIKTIHPALGTQRAVIAVTGGVGNAALISAIGLSMVIVIGILAAIAIPQFLVYRKRGYAATINSDAKNAFTAAQTYFVDDYTGTIDCGTADGITKLALGGYRASTGVACSGTMGVDSGIFTFMGTPAGAWSVTDALIDYQGIMTKSVPR